MLALDPTIFAVVSGTLTIKQTAFSSLGTSTLSAGSELLVVNSATPETTTIQAIANYIS
jgi:hypothetical protein